jgi:RNA polymerase sigma factor (sigma-70 family)
MADANLLSPAASTELQRSVRSTRAFLTHDSANDQLVAACLEGDDHAWAVLIARYRPLILMFSRRYGAGPHDAADIFQVVCAELFVGLPRLRDPQRLPAWVMTVSAHEALRWKRRRMKRVQREGEDLTATAVEQIAADDRRPLDDADRCRHVREAIAELPPRGQELLRLLFFHDPPVPYTIVASRLGIRNTSITTIRARCLEKLKKILLAKNVL